VTQWPGPEGYVVDDDSARLDGALVHAWLSEESYWATGRPADRTERALANSLNFGLYAADGTQAGFCRWVTDRATFAWLCDVFVATPHRGKELGIFLVRTAVEHPEVAGLRLVLGTKDAHELYRRFGFDALAAPERWMEVARPVM
jgi:GNAT superfamily N-acetyltransferase